MIKPQSHTAPTRCLAITTVMITLAVAAGFCGALQAQNTGTIALISHNATGSHDLGRGVGFPVNEPLISITPTNPTTTDSVTITIQGTHPDGCVPTFSNGSQNGPVVTIQLETSPGPCTQALTDYQIGPVGFSDPLPQGQYQVKLMLNGQPFGTTKTFTVTQAGGGGGGGPEITVTPTSPTTNDIVAITIKGTHPDGCVPTFSTGGGLSGLVITIPLETSSGPCTQALTDYQVGPIGFSEPLPAGQYQIKLTLNGQAFGTTKTFTVTQAGGGGFGCTQNATTVCLQNDRFEVTVDYRLNNGATGTLNIVEYTPDTGIGYFFNPNNIEFTIKVLNACSSAKPRYWVFAAGMTDQEMHVTVKDTSTGQVRTYDSTLGTPFVTITDVEAFASCP